MPLVLVFLVLPLIEIALFIVIGGRIGLWPTLALIVLGGLSGVLILRANKARASQVMHQGLQGLSPGTFLAQGAFQIVAGILLILPGFLTDAVGLVLLLPPVQRAILRALKTRVKVQEVHLQARPHPEGDIIEGEFEAREEPEPKPRIDDRRDH
ncbi:FxsA family protein [Pararhodobacter sp. SW119]|uniref:FxsA family protein n=1 Tax=Pararhodobacter sp. SW119 TaxID=2780075 RepID=UPI001AE034AD|nr:FxsA family protein [Pararhodobacter sp. SW119]